jgi:hypothetical protein
MGRKCFLCNVVQGCKSKEVGRLAGAVIFGSVA